MDRKLNIFPADMRDIVFHRIDVNPDEQIPLTSVPAHDEWLNILEQNDSNVIQGNMLDAGAHMKSVHMG